MLRLRDLCNDRKKTNGQRNSSSQKDLKMHVMRTSCGVKRSVMPPTADHPHRGGSYNKRLRILSVHTGDGDDDRGVAVSTTLVGILVE